MLWQRLMYQQAAHYAYLDLRSGASDGGGLPAPPRLYVRVAGGGGAEGDRALRLAAQALADSADAVVVDLAALGEAHTDELPAIPLADALRGVRAADAAVLLLFDAPLLLCVRRQWEPRFADLPTWALQALDLRLGEHEPPLDVAALLRSHRRLRIVRVTLRAGQLAGGHVDAALELIHLRRRNATLAEDVECINNISVLADGAPSRRYQIAFRNGGDEGGAFTDVHDVPESSAWSPADIQRFGHWAAVSVQ